MDGEEVGLGPTTIVRPLAMSAVELLGSRRTLAMTVPAAVRGVGRRGRPLASVGVVVVGAIRSTTRAVVIGGGILRLHLLSMTTEVLMQIRAAWACMRTLRG